MVQHTGRNANLTGSQPGDDEAILNMIDEGSPIYTAQGEESSSVDVNLRREDGFGEEELKNIAYQ